MKILLTGATGFIGKYVLSELAKLPISIIATATHSKKTKSIEYKNVTFISFNIYNSVHDKNLMELFGFPDIVIHLAWHGLPNYEESVHNDQLIYHKAFLKNLIHNGIKKIVVAGTCLEYGMREGKLDENMEAKPTLNYAIAKKDLYHYVTSLQREYDFSMNWLRLFYTYGKGQNEKSLFSQLEGVIKNGNETFNMSKGDQVRDYLPVEIMAEYIVKLSLQAKVEGIVNCCSGEPIEVIQLVKNYLKTIGSNIQLNIGYYPYPTYEPFVFYGCTNKLNFAINNY